jgi:PhnB protein
MTAEAASTSQCPAEEMAEQCPANDIEVRGGVTPYLNVEGAGKAADFYIRAFGATEMARMPPDDKGR